MAAIDWTSPAIVLLLITVGIMLFLQGVLFYFLPPARIKRLALAVAVAGGLAVGTALSLHLISVVSHADSERTVTPSIPEDYVPTLARLTGTTSALERFRQATPAERMTLLNRLPGGPATGRTAWYTVQRGDVDTLVEHGGLDCADTAEIRVKVHARKPGEEAAVIKWIVDNGATVKKGQLLVELDDTELTGLLKAQKVAVDKAKANLLQAQQQAENDSERARRALLDAEIAHLKEIENDIANCKMYAPRDGLVGYCIPERWRVSWGRWRLDPGDSVYQTQRLLYMPDRSKMQVVVYVHESQIALVHCNQTAIVWLDDDLSRFTGKVARIGPVSEERGDAKLYPVQVALTNEKQKLRPGSAEICIRVEPQHNVLRVPGTALVGREPLVCFVQSHGVVEERPVTIGLWGADYVEITSGLKEGDQVLRHPREIRAFLDGPSAHGR